MVEIIAEIPAPNTLKDFKNNKSAIPTPSIPLKISINISFIEYSKRLIFKKKIVIINPITPIRFLIKLICKLLNDLPEKSKRITAQDQQNAVSNAYKSPKLKLILIFSIF